MKLETDTFNRVIIEAGSEDRVLRHRLFEDALCILVPFDFASYRKMSDSEKHKAHCDAIERAINFAEGRVKVPSAEIVEGIGTFRDLGYVNQWLFKKKLFRKQGFTARLECELTLREFTLRLNLASKEGTLFDDVVIRTPPDSIHFYDMFKDVKVDGNVLYIEARNYAPCGPRSFELELAGLARIQ